MMQRVHKLTQPLATLVFVSRRKMFAAFPHRLMTQAPVRGENTPLLGATRLAQPGTFPPLQPACV